MVGKDCLYLPDQGDKIIRTKEIQFAPNVRCLGEELCKAMIRHRNRTAQIDAATGESETFATMIEKCIRVAVNLKRMGVSPNDILTPCTDNHLNAAVIFISIIFTGAKVASIDPFAPDDDRMNQLSLVTPKIIFCSLSALDRAISMVEKLKLDTKIVVFGNREGYMSFDQLLIPHVEEEQIFAPYIPNSIFDTVLIMFSSGTTGNPHAICQHSYALLSLTSSAISFQDDGDDVNTVLMYSSLGWISSIMNVICHTIQGNIRIVCSEFTTQKTWRYIHNYKVTRAMLVTLHLLAMINSERPDGVDISSLKKIVTGAAPISGESIIKARREFPDATLILAYCQTETCGGGTVNQFAASNNLTLVKPGSVGLPVSGCNIKIADPDTEETLGPNQVGEFRVKSKRNMNGYYNEDTAPCFDSDGFLKSGDLMYYDEDGYFYFVERLKEVLRYKLCSINPSELEKILLEYPGVELAVVIGVPSAGGDLPVGVLITQDKNITKNDIHLFLSKRVDEVKTLHGGVIFVERSYIPFTPSGKVNRRALRAKVSQEIV